MTFDPTLLSVHWLRPQWLWVLLVLPACGWWWRARQRSRSPWRDVIDPHLLPHLLDASGRGRRAIAPWLLLLAAALAVAALAGPSWQRETQPLWQDRTPLVIALDLSSATLADDLPPSRLLQARAKIATLLQQRAGGQAGLVAFADDAYTVAPLTDDAANVSLFLDALSPDIMPVDGSRADRAIAASSALLEHAGFSHGDILLITDHADVAARAAAASAVRSGYRVSTLGLGTIGGGRFRDASGAVETARLEPQGLRAVASAGGGAFATLTPGSGDLAALGVLAPHQAGALAADGQTTRVWRDQGYWWLLPVLLLGLLAFRRGNALLVVLLALALPWQPAQAAGSDWWLRPDQQAYARLQQGVVAYRKDDLAGAQRQWQSVPGADAAYNLGNALAKQGRYDDAIAAYDRALHLQPGMADALANRQAVEAARKRKPPTGGQSGNGRGQQEAQSQQQHAQGQQNPQGQHQGTQGQQAAQGQQDQGPQGQQSAQSATPAATPKTDAASAARQRQADAAQRQRMQQALRDAQTRSATRGGSPRPAQPVETSAERERRVANEAWLQRVPDDPGGLLRAKFRLEYDRRQQEGQR